jgi:hypothetical protein
MQTIVRKMTTILIGQMIEKTIFRKENLKLLTLGVIESAIFCF